MRKQIVEPRKEDPMNAGVLMTRVADGIAVITLGSARRIYFDGEMGAQGLALERNLFLKLCITEPPLARMRSYDKENISAPSRSIEVDEGKVNHG
jgi:hypothetical protein